ncbi:MmgE/PrpD family protein [Sphingomonas sp. CL5.1]|uniref:MmgE/PrpD family protein n=1 Tax=Sphingomonas sp. CL5.1 TaxID=2653203 RepID=UPI0015834451|nr:MmgE/PrpD family protein [Sphingomonas sp. CL5.1]QKS00614.1 MmgE/PrpD family protein [Sphingomonas sp. CL5.1]
MSSADRTIERAAAEFVVGFNSGHLDERTRAGVRALLVDQLAIQIGASRLPWSRQARAFRDPRPGTATIAGEAFRARAADAAFINATYGHGFEYDDFNGNAHPGCCVVPVALAVSEETGATLEEMVVALVAGYEIYVRIGYLCSPALLNRGWQPHSVLANFGAAAVAAKLRRLDAEQTSHALAIALSHAGGTTEYASTGGSIKRIHAGIAVRNGVEAVDMALAGITGPRGWLSGDRGFYRMFADQDTGEEAAETFSFDQALQFDAARFKAYCCCAATHGYIQLMEQVFARCGKIERVDARIQTMTDAIVGTRNAHIYGPRNIEELQYSLPAQMALAALGKGNGYRAHRAFLDGNLDLGADSEVIALARKIRLEVSHELVERYPRTFAADVTVHYDDGSSQTLFTDRIKGTPANPFTPEEARAKFDELTIEVIGAGQSSALFDAIQALRQDAPVSALTRHLAFG